MTAPAAGRRGLLATVAASAALRPALAAVPAPAHPDAELLALCREHTTLVGRERAILNAPIAGSHREQIEQEEQANAAVAPIGERQVAVVARLCELRARTLTGVLARAQALEYSQLDDPMDCWPARLMSEFAEERMLGALLRDLLALPTAAELSGIAATRG